MSLSSLEMGGCYGLVIFNRHRSSVLKEIPIKSKFSVTIPVWTFSSALDFSRDPTPLTPHATKPPQSKTKSSVISRVSWIPCFNFSAKRNRFQPVRFKFIGDIFTFRYSSIIEFIRIYLYLRFRFSDSHLQLLRFEANKKKTVCLPLFIIIA